MAAAEHDLGLPVERAQELTLPAVPYAGPDRANVGDGEREQHLQALLGLHDRGQRLGRLRVEEIAALRHVRHDQMPLDEPSDPLGIGGREAQSRTKLAGDLGAGERVIDCASLGDVVQEGREIELGAMRDLMDDLARERVILGKAARLDRADPADRAEEVLVDRVVMVHRELHHADDAAEVGNEPAEHAGLVHASERGLGRVARSEDLEKQAVRLRIVPQAGRRCASAIA